MKDTSTVTTVTATTTTTTTVITTTATTTTIAITQKSFGGKQQGVPTSTTTGTTKVPATIAAEGPTCMVTNGNMCNAVGDCKILTLGNAFTHYCECRFPFFGEGCEQETLAPFPCDTGGCENGGKCLPARSGGMLQALSPIEDVGEWDSSVCICPLLQGSCGAGARCETTVDCASLNECDTKGTSCITKIKSCNYAFTFGFLPDPVTGAHQPKNICSKSLDACVPTTANQYCTAEDGVPTERALQEELERLTAEFNAAAADLTSFEAACAANLSSDDCDMIDIARAAKVAASTAADVVNDQIALLTDDGASGTAASGKKSQGGLIAGLIILFLLFVLAGFAVIYKRQQGNQSVLGDLKAARADTLNRRGDTAAMNNTMYDSGNQSHQVVGNVPYQIPMAANTSGDEFVISSGTTAARTGGFENSTYDSAAAPTAAAAAAPGLTYV